MTFKVICVVAVSGALAMTTHDYARDGGLSASVKGHDFWSDIGDDVAEVFDSPAKAFKGTLCDLTAECAVEKIINNIPRSPTPSSGVVDLNKFPLKYQHAYAALVEFLLIDRVKHAVSGNPGSGMIAGAIKQFLTSIFEKVGFPIKNLLGANLPTSQAELKSKIPKGMSHKLAYAVWVLAFASHAKLDQLSDIMQGPANSVSAQAEPVDIADLGSNYDLSGWARFAQACARYYRQIINFFRGGEAEPDQPGAVEPVVPGGGDGIQVPAARQYPNIPEQVDQPGIPYAEGPGIRPVTTVPRVVVYQETDVIGPGPEMAYSQRSVVEEVSQGPGPGEDVSVLDDSKEVKTIIEEALRGPSKTAWQKMWDSDDDDDIYEPSQYDLDGGIDDMFEDIYVECPELEQVIEMDANDLKDIFGDLIAE